MLRICRCLAAAALAILLAAPTIAQTRVEICNTAHNTAPSGLVCIPSQENASSPVKYITLNDILSRSVASTFSVTCTGGLTCNGGSSTTLGTSPLAINLAGPITLAQGGTGLTSAADDTVIVSNGTAFQAKAVPNCTDISGNHLNYTASTNAFSCGTSGGGGGSGTVTSVGLSVPSWLSVSGTPVTTSGTLAVTTATGQTSGRVVGTCGSGTSVSLCALTAGDLPIVTATKGGTGQDSSSSSGVPKVSSGTWAFNAGLGDLTSSTSSSLRTVLSDETGSGAAVFSTSATLTDATVNQAANGDAVLTSTRATDTFPTGSFLLFKSAAAATLWNVDITGTLTVGTVPVARVSGLAASATTDTTSASNISAGTLAVARGGTGTGSTLTGLMRGNSSAMTAAELSGDVTTSGSNVVTVGKINGVSLAGLATGILKNTTTTGVPSIAAATDFPTLNQSTTGNAATATALAANGSNCSSGQGATGVDASGAAEGCTTYAQVAGDLGNTGGSPQVTSTHLSAPLPPAQGGSGASSPSAHGVLVAEGASAFVSLPPPSGAGSGDMVLASNDSGDPSWQGSLVKTYYKPADQTVTSSSTMQNDDDIVIDIVASHVYKIEIDLFVTADSLGGFAWQPQIGGTLTNQRWHTEVVDDDNGVFFSSVPQFGGSVTGSTTWHIRIVGTVEVASSSSGAIRLQWAQALSNASPTTVLRGSMAVRTSGGGA